MKNEKSVRRGSNSNWKVKIEKWKKGCRGNEKIEKWKLKSEKKVSENPLEDILTWNLSLRILMHK